MSAPFRIVGVLATLTALTLSLSGCRVDNGAILTDGKVVYCTVMADAPHPSDSKITAPGRYRCDGGGADTITMTVTLQKRGTTGDWASVIAQTFVAHGDNTSRKRTEGTRTKTVRADCADGNYRTLVHAVEVSQGNTHTYDMHSVTISNPCG